MKFDGVNNMRVLIERSSAHFIIGSLLSTDPLSLSPAHAEKKNHSYEIEIQESV